MFNEDEFVAMSEEKRASAFFAHVNTTGEIFILNDADGCVMLTSDDEEGVPVWPTASLANTWADQEWEHCTPTAISLDVWLSRWTSGLSRDFLNVIIAPLPGEESDLMLPENFAEKLKLLN